jgi:hypothetical protein
VIVKDNRLEVVDSQLPPDDDLAAFLHRMRPFLLQKESTSFITICKILDWRLEDVILRAVVERQRCLYSGKEFQSEVRITSNATLLNDDKIVLKWLNAYEFHRDKSNRAELDALHQIIPLQHMRAIFISTLMDMGKAVLEITHLIGAMKRGGETTITVKI